MKYHVTLTREALQTLVVEVEADSEEEAREMAGEDPLEFTIISEDAEGFHGYEVQSVEEA